MEFESLPCAASVIKGHLDGTLVEETPLPLGFPQELNSSLSWSGETFKDLGHAILHLTSEEIQELKDSVSKFQESGRKIHELTPEVFKLPRLQERLEAFKYSLHDGLGFFIIRGLEPQKYTNVQNVILHAGICCHIGNRRALQQNYKRDRAEALLHVTDVRRSTKVEDTTDKFLAPGNTNVAIGFHSDNGDNVSLYCRQPATSGGDLFLCSTWAVYNDLAANHRDILKILGEDWQWQTSRSGEQELKFKMQPLFYMQGGKLIVNYQKRPLRGTKEEPRDARLMPLTAAQENALNIVDQLAFYHALPVGQEKGDMHFFNNLCILHARSAFTDTDSDNEGPGDRRHLQRLIFRDDKLGWEIPDKMQSSWSKYYDHALSKEIFALAPEHWAFSLCGHD